MILFICQFYIDKYNLMYIYPLEFESQTFSRKILVKNSLYAVLLFQVGMISLGMVAGHLLSSKIIITFYSLVVL
jgi:hypothetical protein